MVALGVMRLYFGYHDLNAHASTTARVKAGVLVEPSKESDDVDATGCTSPSDMAGNDAITFSV